jgi:hypothetical protein
MAGMHVTRALVFIMPAALLTFLGVAALMRRVGERVGQTRMVAALFALLSLVGGAMLRDALANGPTWYSDYGLTGMQVGARQVFSDVSGYLADHPQSQVWIFPSAWNGGDMLRRFFAPDAPRILLLNLDSFLEKRFDAVEGALVVLTKDDYESVIRSGKFTEAAVEDTLRLPDGTTGFYLVRLSYSSEADAVFAAERDARRRMVAEEIDLIGRRATVRHTPFDIGPRPICRRGSNDHGAHRRHQSGGHRDRVERAGLAHRPAVDDGVDGPGSHDWRLRR